MKKRKVHLRAAVVAAAVGAALVPTPPSWVERFYSGGPYLAWQPLLTSASNLTSFALVDVIIVGILLLTVADIVRGAGGGWLRTAFLMLVRAATRASALYLVFLLAWGLNYRRLPLTEKLRFEPNAVTSDAEHKLAILAASQLGLRYEPAHRARWPAPLGIDARLAASFADTIRQLGLVRHVVVGRPKRSMLDWYFHRAGVDGMTDPFFLETLVATDLLPFERPFVVAHEWSHLAGFADEGEANFVAWLTCLHASVGDQYSGWLFLYEQLAGGLPQPDRMSVAALLAPGPREDLRLIAARRRRQVNPRVAAAGWRAYDRYLKANRIEEGAASYALVVRLALGVQFAEGWVPLPR